MMPADAVSLLLPHVVKISTPGGSGTGFLLFVGKNRSMCAIATAAHVIDHAYFWQEPIRLDHIASGKHLLLEHKKRAIYSNSARDTAAIIFSYGELPLPDDPVALAPQGKFLRVGNDIGWLGFPSVSVFDACYFGGRISAFREEHEEYLVDGVAINGVSGGPAFSFLGESPTIIGIVTAYMPNRATGEALPGLAVVRSVATYHIILPRFQSLEEAKEAESPAPDVPPEVAAPSSATRLRG